MTWCRLKGCIIANVTPRKNLVFLRITKHIKLSFASIYLGFCQLKKKSGIKLINLNKKYYGFKRK